MARPDEPRDPRADAGTTRRDFLAGTAAAAATVAVGTGAAQAADRPNVVLIVVDSLRADHAYGDRARTPNIDALARQGLRFTNVHPEAMPTVPARNSILSGRRYWPFRGWHDYPGLLDNPGWSPITNVHDAFTSVLRRNGYWTAYVTDNPFLGFSAPYARLRRSFDRFRRRGGQVGGKPGRDISARELRHWVPPQLRDPATEARLRAYLANGDYSDDETRSFAARVFKDAARLLEVAAKQRPFALVVDTYQPHEPWTPPRRYLSMYGDPDYRGPEPARPYYAPLDRYLSGRARELMPQRMRALYAAEVTMTDRWLGVFLDKLHSLRLERDTIVVLVADHGFLLGDHGWSGKISNRLYRGLTHVPLILVDPEHRRAGRSSPYFASTHDIAPTLLAMAGVRAPASMTGVDLSPLLRPGGRRPPDRPYAYGGYANHFFVRTAKWTLFAGNAGAGDAHLFAEGTGEARNVAAAHPAKVRELFGVVRRKSGGRLPTYAE